MDHQKQWLPYNAPLALFRQQALALLAGHRAAQPHALALIHKSHPRFLDETVRWMQKRLTPEEIAAAPFDEEDACLALARLYDFRDWPALAAYVASLEDPAVLLFETAVEAVVDGDAAALGRLIATEPDLVHARSNRVTHFDPAVHGATLLHYIAANGVENHRQRTPPNAVAIARILLDAGAEPDSLARLYGGECTTLSLLVSSAHPARAGVQAALVDTLIDYGASVQDTGAGNWVNPVKTALVFGYIDAARALVRRGAPVETLPIAAGLGDADAVARLLPATDAAARHSALALAAQLGHAAVVALLLDAGEDPNRFNPEGHHSHSTPLHQAACAGHTAVVRLLVERGARTDIADRLWQGTPLGWAEHCGQPEAAALLRQLAGS